MFYKSKIDICSYLPMFKIFIAIKEKKNTIAFYWNCRGSKYALPEKSESAYLTSYFFIYRWFLLLGLSGSVIITKPSLIAGLR